MHSFITIGITILEALFFAGIIGSVIVVLLSAVEDVQTMFTGNDTDKEPEG